MYSIPTRPSAAQVLAVRCGASIDTASCGHLTVNRRTFAPGTTDMEAINGTGQVVEALLSTDGRGYTGRWHEGPDSGDTAYVERWTPEGLAFHGFVDSVSRDLVQAG